MKLLVVYIAFSFLEISNCQEAQVPIQGTCDNIGDLRLIHNRGGNVGAIQVCIDVHYNDGTSSTEWRYFLRDGAWTEGAARLACRQLNLGHFDATTSSMKLAWPISARGLRSCTCAETETQLSNCINNYYSKRQNTVATVNCSNGDACAVLDNKIITTTTASNCQQPTAPVPTSTEGDGNDKEMTTNNRQPPSTVMSTSGTLGALIGLLAAALVVVVTGWIVSCVYLQRKIHKKCKDHTHTTPASTSDPTLQLNNPVYDGSTTVPHTMYSSHGPSYEVIDTNEEAGHSYDVISHRGATRLHLPTTPLVSNEEYSTLDTSRENEYHTLESNTGDGQYSMVGHTDPQNDGPDPPQGEEYSTLKH